MLNAPKHCRDLDDSTFTIFIDPCEYNWVLKSFSEWYAKSWDCFLTHWLPIGSIPFLCDATYGKIFRWNYLRNGKQFVIFFFEFSIFTFNFELFQKKRWPSKLMYFWSHWLRKMWLDKYLKRSFSEDHLRSNMVNVLKHCSKLNGSTFTILIHPCERNSSLKSFSEWYAKS